MPENVEERTEEFAELRKKGNEKLLAVISTDQRATFKKLQGKKVEIELTLLRRCRNNYTLTLNDIFELEIDAG